MSLPEIDSCISNGWLLVVDDREDDDDDDDDP